MNQLTLVLFATAAGYTLSAIAATLYRIAGAFAKTDGGPALRLFVLVFAGPSVFFVPALRGFRNKEWSACAFWLTTAGIAYWSLILGLMLLDMATLA